MLQQNYRQLQHYFTKYNLPVQDLEQDIRDMHSFKVTTPIIGGFSTGKSSMINALLNQRLVQTKITAETAVPAEVSYGKPAVHVIKGHARKAISFADLLEQEFSAEGTDYIEVQLENEALSHVPTLKLVDMPGFDSGIELHNKAIDQYVPKSLAYILTFAAEEPVVKESIADFLKELKLYDVPVYVCVTKADKVTEDVLERNIAAIRRDMERLLGVAPKRIVAIWSKKNKNTDGLQEILRDIEASSQQIFSQRYTERLQMHRHVITQYLEEMLKGTELTVSDLDEKEARLQRDMEHVQTKIEREQRQFEKQLQSAISAIQGRIDSALYENKESLKAMLVSGGHLESKLNVIVRTAVTAGIREEFEPKLQKHIEKLLGAIQLDMPIDTAIQMDPTKIQTDQMMKELAVKSLPLILGALGVVITGPIGGLLIGLGTLFAEIFFQKKRNDEKAAEAERKLTGEIIPQVVQLAGANVETELLSYVDSVHALIQEEVGKQRDVLQKALDDIRQQKQAQQMEQEQLKIQLQTDLHAVKNEVNV